MAQNSSTKHLKLLKKIINLSVANSYMAFNPFSTYKVEREPVEVDFLDEEELRKIIKTTDRIVFLRNLSVSLFSVLYMLWHECIHYFCWSAILCKCAETVFVRFAFRFPIEYTFANAISAFNTFCD